MFSYILHFYLLKERNFIFFLSFVVYHKCWSVCPAGAELTNHTGPLLASDLVNWEAAQLLSWITDLCTELPRLRSRNRGGEWRKVSMGLWQGPVRMPWKMPLLLNNLLCCSRLKPSSPAPCSSVEDAFHACWGECTTKMPHGWCQRGLTQPKLPCPVPLLWLHAGPQPDTGTWEMSPLFSVGSTDPCTDRVPASPGITTGCVFRWGQASPGAHAGRTVCDSVCQTWTWWDVVPWEPPSLHRGWSSCWTSKNLGFLEGPKAGDLPWWQSNRTSVGPSALQLLPMRCPTALLPTPWHQAPRWDLSPSPCLLHCSPLCTNSALPRETSPYRDQSQIAIWELPSLKTDKNTPSLTPNTISCQTDNCCLGWHHLWAACTQLQQCKVALVFMGSLCVRDGKVIIF